jgi:hypothetical protein
MPKGIARIDKVWVNDYLIQSLIDSVFEDFKSMSSFSSFKADFFVVVSNQAVSYVGIGLEAVPLFAW